MICTTYNGSGSSPCWPCFACGRQIDRGPPPIDELSVVLKPSDTTPASTVVLMAEIIVREFPA